MSTTRSVATVLLLAESVMLSACSSLVPNYEVLRTPIASTFFEPGRGWNTETGAPDTARNPNVTVTVHDGLAKLEAGNTDDANAKISVPVIEWIGGALGIKSSEKIHMSFKGLKHTVIDDARSLTGTGAILWEAVTADSLALTIDTSSDVSLDLKADLVKAKLAESGSVGLEVTKNSSGNYSISSDKPLVVMIRVVRLDWATSGGDTPFDLSSAGRNREQKAMLGYSVTPGDPLDPLEEKVKLSLHNDTFPMWTGATFTTSRDKPTWANTRREVITSGNDPGAKNARFVWDAMRVLWNTDLSKCQLHTVRQYLSIHNVPSGLKGTL